MKWISFALGAMFGAVAGFSLALFLGWLGAEANA